MPQFRFHSPCAWAALVFRAGMGRASLRVARQGAHSVVAVALVVCLFVDPAGAQAPALGFEEALRIAAERSQALVASDAEVQAARERVIAAGQRPDPTLKLGINNLPIEGPDRFSLTRDFMTMQSVGVMQEMTRSDKRQARIRRAEVDIETGLISRQTQLAELQRETAVAWLERSYLESVRALLARQVDEAQLLAESAEVAYRAGGSGQPEIFSARASIASLRDRIMETDRRIASATTRLARWLGPLGDQPLDQRPSLDTLLFSATDLRRHLRFHPTLMLAANEEEKASAEVEVASAARKPDWSVELMYSKRGSAYSDMISVNVSVPLQFDRSNRQDRELAAKIALREQARALREERFRAHQAEVLAMIQEWQTLRERMSNYDRALLPLASQRTEAAVTAYRAGSGSLVMVLDSRRMELDVRMEQLRLEMEAARLWAQLNYLIPVEPTTAAPPLPPQSRSAP